MIDLQIVFQKGLGICVPLNASADLDEIQASNSFPVGGRRTDSKCRQVCVCRLEHSLTNNVTMMMVPASAWLASLKSVHTPYQASSYAAIDSRSDNHQV